MSCFESDHTDHRLPLTGPNTFFERLKGLNRQIRSLCDGSDRARVPLRSLTHLKYQETDVGRLTDSCGDADSSFLSCFDAIICPWVNSVSSHPTNDVGPDGLKRQTNLHTDARTQRFPAEHSRVTTQPLLFSSMSEPISIKAGNETSPR